MIKFPPDTCNRFGSVPTYSPMIIIHDGFPRFRFSLRTLLEILTLVAVGLGAYLVGQENGYHHGWHSASDSVQAKVWEQSVKINALEKERDALASKLDEK